MKDQVNQEERAFMAWNVLIDSAKNEKFITYKELGDEIGIHHRAIRYVLGFIQEYCMANAYPPLTILVINKDTGMPGDGFIAWDIENTSDGVKKVQKYDWTSLLNPFGYAEFGISSNELVKELINNPDSATDIYSRVKVRGAAQAIFRQALLEVYNYSCCFCGLSFDNVLEACHIIPYSKSGLNQRLEIGNGLLLCANHHKMFDSGQITINQDYSINYFDTEEEEGDYSNFDRLMTIELDGLNVRLPMNISHHPSFEYLKEHQETFNE